MTTRECLKMIESYYGRYERAVVKETVVDYLGQFRETELEILYQRLILDYSGQYKYTPDVAILEDIKKQINEEQRNKVEGILIGTDRERPRTPKLPEPISEEERQSAGQILRGLLKKWGIRSE